MMKPEMEPTEALNEHDRVEVAIVGAGTAGLARFARSAKADLRLSS